MEYLILINEESKPVLVEVLQKADYIDFKNVDNEGRARYDKALNAAISDKSKHIQFKDEPQTTLALLESLGMEYRSFDMATGIEIWLKENVGQTFPLPDNVGVSFEEDGEQNRDGKLFAILSKLEERSEEIKNCKVLDRIKFKGNRDICANDLESVVAPSEEVKQRFTDKQRIDWLEKMMTPDDRFCEIYFAGLRDFKTGRASSFQIESNPDIIKYQQAPTLREAIDLAIKNEKVLE